MRHCQALTWQPMLLQVQHIQHPFLDAVSNNLAIIASMHEEGISAHLIDEGNDHIIARVWRAKTCVKDAQARNPCAAEQNT